MAHSLLYKKSCVSFGILLFLVQIACFGDTGTSDAEIERRLNQLKLQYETVSDVHLKSKYSKSVFNPQNSNDINSKQMFYEYWANSNTGQFRGHTTVLASEDFAGYNVEFADNGEIWQYYQKDTSTFSYGEKRFKQNPDALENPLFSPISFLGKSDDSCPAYVLSFKDVQDEANWQKMISQAKRIEKTDQKQGQLVIELPGSVLIGKKFVYHIYFSEFPDYLPEKIAWVSDGDIFKLIEIQYQKIESVSEQIYWPQKVHVLGIPSPDVITEKLDIEVEEFEIDKELPLNIFDIDFSSAEVVWNNDLEMFIRQKGGFAPSKYLKAEDICNDKNSPSSSQEIANNKNYSDTPVEEKQPLQVVNEDATRIVTQKSNFPIAYFYVIAMVLLLSMIIVFCIYIVKRKNEHV